MLPPGDLRMALAALCGDDEWGETWAQRAPAPVRRHRRDARPRRRQPADRQPLGAARRPRRRARLGRPAARGARARAADGAHAAGHHRRGQRPRRRTIPSGSPRSAARWRWRRADGAIEAIALLPDDLRPCPEAVAAVRDADMVVLGPGLVVHLGAAAPDGPDAARALVETDGPPRRRAQPGAAGRRDRRASRAADHLAVLLDHAPDLAVGTVLVDRSERRRTWRARGAGRQVRCAASWSPTSPATTAPRGTTRTSWRRRTPRSWRAVSLESVIERRASMPVEPGSAVASARSASALGGWLTCVAGSAPWR